VSSKIPDDLIYAAFFFVDIVGLSNPILSTETQKTKIKIFWNIVFLAISALWHTIFFSLVSIRN